MAAWSSGSAIMNAFVQGSLSGTANYPKIATEAMKVALFNNTTVPDNSVAAATSAYNTGVWVTANEVTDATNWQAGGRSLAGGAVTTGGGPPAFVMFDATDTAGGGNVTLANVYGDLLYDTVSTAVTNQGLAFHSYGGSAQGVTAGTFTIVWHVNGLMRWTHAQA